MFTKRSAVAFAVLLFVATVGALALPSAQVFRVRDDCDPATFNLELGDGACNPRFGGDTTFQKFIRELTEDKTVGAWRFNPDKVGLDRGQKSIIESRGGEFHTFTRVAEFGGGIVPPLNDLSGAGATRPECGSPGQLAGFSATNVPVPSGSAFPGPTAGTQDLPGGTTKWQCCIHPWMRSVVTVK